jgi:hypothetical protein
VRKNVAASQHFSIGLVPTDAPRRVRSVWRNMDIERYGVDGILWEYGESQPPAGQNSPLAAPGGPMSCRWFSALNEGRMSSRWCGLRHVSRRARAEYEILVVNDGSWDRTGAISTG